MQLAVSHLRKRTDRNLAAPAQTVEQRAFAGSRSAGGGIVQKFQMPARHGVTQTDLDAQRSLPRRWAHDFRRNNLFDELRLAQPLQSCRCENDRVVLSLLQLAQPRVDVPPQRMNVEIWPNRLQLRLPPQARRAHSRALRQILKAFIMPRAECIAR